MLDAVSHVGVWVHDQDAAKEFYTEKLGFEVRQDNTLPDFGEYRWLTVGPPGQPDVSIILSYPGPPAVDAESASRRRPRRRRCSPRCRSRSAPSGQPPSSPASDAVS